MSKRGLLIMLSGPPDVGESTVRGAIFKSEDNDFQYSISMTTHKMHEGEVESVDYSFRSKKGFELMIEAREMLEHTEYVGNYYGTPLSHVSKALDEGKGVFLEIEVQGVRQVREKVPDGVFIFLTPSDLAGLKSRVVGRGTNADEIIGEQIKVTKEGIKIMALYDYAVVNDEVLLAVERIEDIIASEYFRVGRVIGKYIKMLGEM